MSFGIIHSSWLKELTASEAALLSFIATHTTKEGYCLATNKHLASILRLSTRHIRNLISCLAKKGFVVVEVGVNANIGSARRIKMTPKALVS